MCAGGRRWCKACIRKHKKEDTILAGFLAELSRCVYNHSHAKWRTIQNARRSGTNDCASVLERLFNIQYDVAILLLVWLRRVLGNRIPEHLAPRVGTDDMIDAYRIFPSRLAHLRWCIMAV